MNLRKVTTLAVMVLMIAAPATPAFAVSKEIIQLQTQVQDLADRMAAMKQSFDERMGVMRSLVEQTTDNMNKLTESVQAMQKVLQQQNADSQAKIDQVSGQIQTLNDSIDELKARLAKTGKQLEDIQNQQQNLPQPSQTTPAGAPAGAPPAGAPTAAPTGAAAQAPPADVLYNNALRDYNSARYELALSQFQDYIKYYPTTDLAGNAQFYIADIEYRAGNFEAAVADYDKVLEQFPGGNKAAAAQLKKGYSLLELGRKDAGIRELNALIQRYPHAIEATQARERLRKLGASSARPASTHKAH
jgi:tol-pal system protein YbgF